MNVESKGLEGPAALVVDGAVTAPRRSEMRPGRAA